MEDHYFSQLEESLQDTLLPSLPHGGPDLATLRARQATQEQMLFLEIASAMLELGIATPSRRASQVAKGAAGQCLPAVAPEEAKRLLSGMASLLFFRASGCVETLQGFIQEQMEGKSRQDQSPLPNEVAEAVKGAVQDLPQQAVMLRLFWATCCRISEFVGSPLPPRVCAFQGAAGPTADAEDAIANGVLEVMQRFLERLDSSATILGTQHVQKRTARDALSALLVGFSLFPGETSSETSRALSSLFAAVYEGDPDLCESLWCRESSMEEPLWRYFLGVRARFPVEAQPFLQCLSALSSDVPSAYEAFLSLRSLESLAVPSWLVSRKVGGLSISFSSSAANTTTESLSASISLPGSLGGITFPAGAMAAALRPSISHDDLLAVGLKEGPVDGIAVLITRLKGLLTEGDVLHAEGSQEPPALIALRAMRKILLRSQAFARYCLSVDGDGNLLSGLSMALSPAAGVAMIKEALLVVASFFNLGLGRSIFEAAFSSNSVLTYYDVPGMPKSGLREHEQDEPQLSNLFAPGCMPLLERMHRNERHRGRYEVTIASLEAFQAILRSGLRPLNTSAAVISHLLGALGSSCSRWHAIDACSWRKLIAAFNRCCIAGISSQALPLSLKRGLAWGLAKNAGCAETVTSPLSLDADTQERLQSKDLGCLGSEEVDASEEAVTTTLLLLPKILNLISPDHDSELMRIMCSGSDDAIGPRLRSVASFLSPFAAPVEITQHAATCFTCIVRFVHSSHSKYYPSVRACCPSLFDDGQNEGPERSDTRGERRNFIGRLEPSEQGVDSSAYDVLLALVEYEPLAAQLLFVPCDLQKSKRDEQSTHQGASPSFSGATDHVLEAAKKVGTMPCGSQRQVFRLLQSLWRADTDLDEPLQLLAEQDAVWSAVEAAAKGELSEVPLETFAINIISSQTALDESVSQVEKTLQRLPGAFSNSVAHFLQEMERPKPHSALESCEQEANRALGRLAAFASTAEEAGLSDVVRQACDKVSKALSDSSASAKGEQRNKSDLASKAADGLERSPSRNQLEAQLAGTLRSTGAAWALLRFRQPGEGPEGIPEVSYERPIDEELPEACCMDGAREPSPLGSLTEDELELASRAMDALASLKNATVRVNDSFAKCCGCVSSLNALGRIALWYPQQLGSEELCKTIGVCAQYFGSCWESQERLRSWGLGQYGAWWQYLQMASACLVGLEQNSKGAFDPSQDSGLRLEYKSADWGNFREERPTKSTGELEGLASDARNEIESFAKELIKAMERDEGVSLMGEEWQAKQMAACILALVKVPGNKGEAAVNNLASRLAPLLVSRAAKGPSNGRVTGACLVSLRQLAKRRAVGRRHVNVQRLLRLARDATSESTVILAAMVAAEMVENDDGAPSSDEMEEARKAFVARETLSEKKGASACLSAAGAIASRAKGAQNVELQTCLASFVTAVGRQVSARMEPRKLDRLSLQDAAIAGRAIAACFTEAHGRCQLSSPDAVASCAAGARGLLDKAYRSKEGERDVDALAAAVAWSCQLLASFPRGPVGGWPSHEVLQSLKSSIASLGKERALCAKAVTWLESVLGDSLPLALSE